MRGHAWRFIKDCRKIIQNNVLRYKRIFLRRGRDEALQRFHPWVFSGAIAKSDGQPEEGEVVDVCSSDGTFMARGHCQIGSIAVRVLTFDDREDIDAAFWRRRIEAAYDVRRAAGLTDSEQTTCYRLVHGEGDGLSGLVIDIYGAEDGSSMTAVVQCHTVGMFLSREQIATALREVYGDRLTSIYDKSSQTVPFNAGLDAHDGYLYGKSAHPVAVLENGNKFYVDWVKGQKTGFFLDQRYNRYLVGEYARGRRLLNTFCYTGGFSVYGLAGGAERVVSVDSSAIAVELTDRNMELNFGPDAPHKAVAEDTFEFLRSVEKGEFDMIILDPPAFAKHQRVLKNATQGYKRLNAAAMEKIAPGGILFTFSCSQAVSSELFRTTVFSAAAIAKRNVRILHQLTQPADHPVNIFHPEGEYLKGLVLYVE